MGYNRYTYALNNPISYIDPSGNEPLTLLTSILVGAAISGLGYTASAAFAPGGLEKNFNIGGFLGSVGTGAVSGAITAGIGSVFGGVTAVGNLTASSVFNELGRATAHGLVGIGFSIVQGGDAWAGFAASFAGSLAGSTFQSASVGLSKAQVLIGGGIFSMGVGAGTSYIAGGDPWIGAGLAGLSFYANHMLHPGGGDGDGDGDGKGDKEKKMYDKRAKVTATGVAATVNGYLNAASEYAATAHTKAPDLLDLKLSAKGLKYVRLANGALGVVTKGLGVKAMYDHGSQAVESYNAGDYKGVILNSGKVVLDAVFMFGKASNPLILIGGITYNILDMAGY